MSILDSVSNFFDDDKSGAKALAQRRKERNENFKQQIKAQLFFSEEEANLVIKLIKKYDKKCDDIMKRFDVNNHQYIQTERMHAQMMDLQIEMKDKLKEMINAIMHEKLRQAKEYFAEHPEQQ